MSRMPAARKRTLDQDTAARTALLDAAQAIMLEEGYAAVSSRKLAAKAGTNSALVYYYFANMDDLFVELFRRGAERALERQATALISRQPLWGLWELAHDLTSGALSAEFIALAHHRKSLRKEIAAFSARLRNEQVDGISAALRSYGVDPAEWPPATVVLLMSGVSRSMLAEQDFGLDIGHRETTALVERHIRALEGERDPALHQHLFGR